MQRVSILKKNNQISKDNKQLDQLVMACLQTQEVLAQFMQQHNLQGGQKASVPGSSYVNNREGSGANDPLSQTQSSMLSNVADSLKKMQNKI